LVTAHNIYKVNGWHGDKYYSSARVIDKIVLSRKYVLLELQLLNEFKKPKPPQFIMLWIPGYEAIPMSIAGFNPPDKILLFIKRVGKTTNYIYNELSVDSMVGVIGPLGKPLILRKDSKYLFLAGGSGLASILHYIRYHKCTPDKCLTVYGNWSSRDMGVIPRLIRKLGSRVITVCMDNGCDVKGLVVNALNTIDEDFDYIVSCGPIDMIRDILGNSHRLGTHIVILDSYVKCGLGLCGSCLIPGTKYYLCIDGPGFYAEDVINAIFSRTWTKSLKGVVRE